MFRSVGSIIQVHPLACNGSWGVVSTRVTFYERGNSTMLACNWCGFANAIYILCVLGMSWTCSRTRLRTWQYRCAIKHASFSCCGSLFCVYYTVFAEACEVKIHGQTERLKLVTERRHHSCASHWTSNSVCARWMCCTHWVMSIEWALHDGCVDLNVLNTVTQKYTDRCMF